MEKDNLKEINIIKQIEKLVNKVADCHNSIDSKDVEKMNELTGNNWDGDVYAEYCCEYWSHNSLEETVWALMHNGEYPDCEEEEICFWKVKKNADISDVDIYEGFRYGRNGKVKNKLETLPVKEIVYWISDNFKDWKQRDDEFNLSEDELSQCQFKPIVQREYGIERCIHIASYSMKMFCLILTNVTAEEKESIICYLRNLGYYMYVPVE